MLKESIRPPFLDNSAKAVRRAFVVLLPLFGSTSSHADDLHRNGNPEASTLGTWYTQFGAAVRDAEREISDKCYHTPDTIVVCARRRNFRINPNVLRAAREADEGFSGNDYDRYLQAKEKSAKSSE